MDYMQRHGLKRSRPTLLHPGTVRIISVRMDYRTEASATMEQQLADPAFSLHFPLCAGPRLPQADAGPFAQSGLSPQVCPMDAPPPALGIITRFTGSGW